MEISKQSASPKPLKLALIGYGKMGKAIEEIAMIRGHVVGLKINSKNNDQLSIENLQKCDVAIEFTEPGSAVKNITTCIDAGVPVISGSTGWLQEWNHVSQYCISHNGALLYASNFSIGVNIFFEINKKLATLMATRNEYDVMIEEIHHTQKKDSPSGTAITLAKDIITELQRKHSWINTIAESKEELTIVSKRIEMVPGTHIIKYTSDVDDIEIIHQAHNRTGFAQGALLAATFLAGKKGIFTMKDVLGIH